MRITDRDMTILKTLAKFQCLSTSQICRLYFDGLKNCQRRLRLLGEADYLSSVSVPNTNPGKPENLYYLGNKGSELLNFPASKPRFTLELSHQQKNTDLMIDTILAFRKTELDCNILPEHLIRIAANQQLIPDGAIMLSKNDSSALFLLENDCSTEPLRSLRHNDLEAKLATYANIFKNNQVELYNHFFDRIFNRFRLLLITDRSSRFRAISNLITKYDKHGFMLIATLPDFKKHGVDGNIWNLPAENKSQLSITG